MSNLFLIATIDTFCADLRESLEVIGIAMTIFKVAIPLFIIILGIIDLGKAAISSKPEEIKKCATSLIWRIAGGIIIFLLPTIIMAAFGLFGGFNKGTDEIGTKNWAICNKCISSTTKECRTKYNDFAADHKDYSKVCIKSGDAAGKKDPDKC